MGTARPASPGGRQGNVLVQAPRRPDGAIVLLTVFRKTRQHDQRQIDQAVRAKPANVATGAP